MPQQRLYYEYVDEKLIPYWYVLTFRPCELNWDNPIFHFDVIKPFEYVERDEFDESKISMSIYLTDLILNDKSPERMGVNLNTIKSRLIRYKVDPGIVRQFIISAPEVYDLLELLPKHRKMDLLVS
jgi:hypothetical protein